MAVPEVPSVDAIEQRFQELLARAREYKPTESIDPPLWSTDFLTDLDYLTSSIITNASLHNLRVSAAAHKTLFELLSRSTAEDPAFAELWNFIDILQLCIDKENLENNQVFALVEEVLDSQSVDGCRKVFDYLESRRERLTSYPRFFENMSGKLCLLRSCNELLRRLSRAEDSVLCGRIFIFMFQSFPLGDSSSVNKGGEFHVDNVTSFDDDSSKEAQDDMQVEQQDRSEIASMSTETLYPIFWTLQRGFSNPPSLFHEQHLTTFKSGLEATLLKFKDVSVIQTRQGEQRRGVKRKSYGDEDHASNYNPKYLTSRDLFQLELTDLAFQRHVLVQALIVLDFLLNFTDKVKKKVLSINKTKGLQFDFVLDPANTEWAEKMRTSIADYLQKGPDGKFYYRMVDTVLQRDKNWLRWKMEGANLISRPSDAADHFVEAKAGAEKVSMNKRLRPVPMGSMDLAFLSQSETADGLERLKDPARYKLPSEDSYVKDVENTELDFEMAMTNEEKQKLEETKASQTWCLLRLATKNELGLLDKVDDGRNLKALLDRQEPEEPMEEEPQVENAVPMELGDSPATQAVEVQPELQTSTEAMT